MKLIKKFFLVLVLFILSSSSYALEKQTFKCDFIDSSQFSTCNGVNKDIAFYASGDIRSSDLTNAKVSVHESNYPYALCCSSDYKDVQISFNHRTNSCLAGELPFAYLQSEYNSKLRLENNSIYNIPICLQASSAFAELDIKVDRINSGFDAIGYDCMYRFGSGYSVVDNSLVQNGKLSSCDYEYFDLSTYNKYPFAVFARLLENVNTLVCNNDCTSQLDNRIYVSCGVKVRECSTIPAVCDGSLSGAWVKFDNEREIRCQKPFNQYRDIQISENKLNVKVNSEAKGCENLITSKYNVLLNQETVTMNIYICSD